MVKSKNRFLSLFLAFCCVFLAFAVIAFVGATNKSVKAASYTEYDKQKKTYKQMTDTAVKSLKLKASAETTIPEPQTVCQLLVRFVIFQPPLPTTVET